MIIIFIGPPFSGKGTQAKIISDKLNLPVFSMGALIREACEKGDPKAKEGFEQFSLKGFHLPVSLKFYLLKGKLDELKDGFILDNFPASKEDLDAFNGYLKERKLKVSKVFYIFISKEEMIKRLKARERKDDSLEIVLRRRRIQDQDRISVIEFFKRLGVLEEINGEGSIEETNEKILRLL